MAVKLQEVSTWLNNIDISHQVIEEKSMIMTGMSGEDYTIGINIKLVENGEMFQIYSNLLIDDELNVLKVKDHKNLSLVFQYMLKINYDEKFGTWEYDPKDGEVRFAVEFPLEDNSMTEKQFIRIFKHIVNSNKIFQEILNILETGKIPEENSEEMFDAFLEMMLEAKLKEKFGEDASLDSLQKRLKDSNSSQSKLDDDGI